MPEGDDIQKAIKWISSNLEDNPDQPVFPLVEKAVFKFDLSPKDSDFLMTFFKKRKSGGQ
jgi:hypothetical protein